ncbi:MAG TPA: hemerythrin domain-containing protein [Nocardioidaceae bacterium]|nr:hemerythrin domain-containing protein [Nocardioidaceae bacterium]
MDDDVPRLRAFSEELLNIHDDLRAQLAWLREGKDAVAGRSLAAHCLAFCAALSKHHTAEDSIAFPALAEQRPALRQVLEGMTQDHEMIASLLARVEAITHLLDDETPDEAVESLHGELDGLSTILESHFPGRNVVSSMP